LFADLVGQRYNYTFKNQSYNLIYFQIIFCKSKKWP